MAPTLFQLHMHLSTRRFAHLGLLASLAGGLLACDKNDYTTWVCNPSADSVKVIMVLSRSVMTLDPPQAFTANANIQDQSDLRFCGSLGNDSFFDARCPADTKSALVQFTPGSGALRLGTQTMQCTVL